jgi:hypothetical protein
MLPARPGSVELADLTLRERDLMLLVLGGTLHVHNLMTRLAIDSDEPGSKEQQRRGLRRLTWWSAPSPCQPHLQLARCLASESVLASIANPYARRMLPAVAKAHPRRTDNLVR